MIAEVFLNAQFIVATSSPNLWIPPVLTVWPDALPYGSMYLVPIGGRAEAPKSTPATVTYEYRDGVTPEVVMRFECAVDVNHDGDCGTDSDIEAWFAAYAASDDGVPSCADWDGSGVVDAADIVAFFLSVGGG